MVFSATVVFRSWPYILRMQVSPRRGAPLPGSGATTHTLPETLMEVEAQPVRRGRAVMFVGPCSTSMFGWRVYLFWICPYEGK